MAFSWVELVRLIHVVSAAIWFGGVVMGIVIIGPGVRAAGPPGKAFMGALMKRGGFARLMGPASGLTILAGLVLFWGRGYHDAPFADLPSSILSIGAMIGLFAFIIGYAVGLPMQKKMMAHAKSFGPTGPTPEQAATMEAMGAKQAKMGTMIGILIALSFVLMVGRNVFY